MNTDIRKLLIETAKLRTTIFYGQLNDQLRLGYDFDIEYDRKLIGDDLGEISEHEHEKGRPLLSSLVVRKGTGYEGDGFYKLCEQLGFGDWETLKRSKTFDRDQRKDCSKFWRDKSNYDKYKND